MGHVQLNATPAENGQLSREPRLQRIINESLHGVGFMRDQSKYRIFGWEFLPREKLDAAANVAVSMKDFIE